LTVGCQLRNLRLTITGQRLAASPACVAFCGSPSTVAMQVRVFIGVGVATCTLLVQA
jgi:hypothetical protein